MIVNSCSQFSFSINQQYWYVEETDLSILPAWKANKINYYTIAEIYRQAVVAAGAKMQLQYNYYSMD